MKSRMKKILGFLTVLCLAAGIRPLSTVPAYADTAAGTGKSMQQISADNPGGGIADGDHIYLGTKDGTNYTWTDDAPYWRVLDAEKMNTGDAGMFLLSESLIGNNPVGSYGNIYFNQDYTKGNAWHGSDARDWCGGFLTNVFSQEEQAAIASADKDDVAYHYHDNEYDYDVDFGASSGILEGDRVFFLSAEEADSTAYGFTDNASRKANYGSGAGKWWLRSPYANSTKYAGLVYSDGSIDYFFVDLVFAARPALNINLSSVLFTSAAEGGKSSGATGADSLKLISDYSGNDWKLTLLDSARSEFTASFGSMSGDVATIKYSGATAVTNDYISAIIVNSSGEITHYGRLASASAEDDSTCTVNLEGKYEDGDTLYVFNEQVNGDKKTDYSSELKKIEIPTEKFSLTITAKDQTYEYNGQDQGPGDMAYNDQAVIAEKFKVEGLQGNDYLFSIVLDGQAKEIGTHKEVLVPSGAVIHDSDEKDVTGNYGIKYVNGNLIITGEEPPVPPEPHVHSLTLVKAKEATCTEAGSKAYYVCDTCGKWFEDATALVEITDRSSVTVKALGHKWDKGTVTKEATYTAEGVRTYTCLNDSSHTKTEAIPKKKRSSSGGSERTSVPLSGAWFHDEAGWHYRENGSLLKDTWRFLSYNDAGYWYYFDESGTMKTGWLDRNGNRYYLYPVSDGWMGRMLTGWQQIDGKWYYFETAAGNSQGRMYRDERTPDGFYVGADGAWDGNPAAGGR